MKTLGRNFSYGILFLYLLYSAIALFQSSFVIDGVRYYSLVDDMMISMRFAKHLASGIGLMWNTTGVPVEGYTNLLWTLFMAVVHLFPLPPSKISLVIECFGALFLAANLIVVKKIVEHISHNSTVATGIAILFTAFYYPLNHWAYAGTEVSLLTLCVSTAVLLALRYMKTGRGSMVLYMFMAGTALIRSDAIVPVLVILGWLIYYDRKNIRRHLLVGLPISGIGLFFQLLFRLSYYHDIFPNTYYLKMVGYPLFLRITRGGYVLLHFIWQMNWIVFLSPLYLLLQKKGSPAVKLLFSLFIVQLGYSVFVGGDSWEFYGGSNRFIAIVMPLFFILLGVTFGEVKRKIKGLRIPQVLFAVFVILSFFSVNVIQEPHALKRLFLLEQSSDVSDEKQNVMFALALNKGTDKQAKVAVTWAGTVPYFTERLYVDILGKIDTHIGHEQMHISQHDYHAYIGFLPGHMKWDSAYSIGKLRPDVIMHYWPPSLSETRPFIEKHYHEATMGGLLIYVRNDTKYVNLKP